MDEWKPPSLADVMRSSSCLSTQFEALSTDSGVTLGYPNGSSHSNLRESPLRVHSLSRIGSSMVDLEVRLPDGQQEVFRNVKYDKLQSKFEYFQSTPMIKSVRLAFQPESKFDVVRQLLEDKRLVLNTIAEMADALNLTEQWRGGSSIRQRVVDRLQQLDRNSVDKRNNMTKIVRDNLLKPDELKKVFKNQLEDLRKQLAAFKRSVQMFKEPINDDFLRQWLPTLNDPLLGEKCPFVDEVDELFHYLFTRRIAWHEINILDFFLPNPFVHSKKSIQNAISHNITRYLRENGANNFNPVTTDGPSFPAHLADKVLNQLAYVMVRKGWKFDDDHILSEYSQHVPKGQTALKHHTESHEAIHTFYPHYQFALEYFLHELETLEGLQRALRYYNNVLRERNIIKQDLTPSDICSGIMTPLQKAVEMNQVELVHKYIKVFGLDVNGVTAKYNLPPVYIAASKRKVRITQMLIYAGADLMGPVEFGGKNLTMFDVICSNPTTFLKTSESQRRDLAREFYQRNIRDAKTVNAAYPTTPPHFMNSQWTTSNSWPALPKSEFNGSTSMLLKQFIRGNR
ncbi:unnamed protein product [Oikopleura dioica]|uniref:Uncharacterized protein n=1 Tax=Oikopleura dioica TaxID=34765 RepID=E4YSJ2_OIKDI|nr:unnamed protein product [Oikopleura dioica]